MGVDAVVDLVEPGGIVVLDDFTPCESWPPITYGRVDTLREQWLTDERFTAVEVMVARTPRRSSPRDASLAATSRQDLSRPIFRDSPDMRATTVPNARDHTPR